MLTLVEKAEATIKESDAEAMTKRMLSSSFNFNDFLQQSKMMSSMGSMGSIMKMLPGQLACLLCYCLTIGLCLTADLYVSLPHAFWQVHRHTE